jgi:hypothetical protein
VACGGCDTVKSQDEICERILKAVNRGWNVLFEGLICSHISKRYAELYHNLRDRGIRVRFIYLSTPLEKCRSNINLRRAKQGKSPKVAKNTEKDYTSTHNSRNNMAGMGVRENHMPLLSSKKAYRYILHQLEKENNDG